MELLTALGMFFGIFIAPFGLAVAVLGLVVKFDIWMKMDELWFYILTPVLGIVLMAISGYFVMPLFF